MSELATSGANIHLDQLTLSERRASVRRVCKREVLSRRRGATRNAAWLASVRNISETGLGLLIYCNFAPGSILSIEPLSRRSTRTLLARVVHVSQEGDGWIHGCELANQLTEREVADWL